MRTAYVDQVMEAIAAVERGDLIVYPTETVYGLGANALDPAAVESAFRLKGRDRSAPLSVAIPGLDGIERVAHPDPPTRRFIEAFLPGPVTVVCPADPALPDALLAGRDRVGVRIPDHPLARSLLERSPPLTATSANPSGGSSPQAVADLAPSIRDGVAAVLDGGRTGGTGSTVVDPGRDVVHRAGPMVERVDRWLDDA